MPLFSLGLGSAPCFPPRCFCSGLGRLGVCLSLSSCQEGFF